MNASTPGHIEITDGVRQVVAHDRAATWPCILQPGPQLEEYERLGGIIERARRKAEAMERLPRSEQRAVIAALQHRAWILRMAS